MKRFLIVLCSFSIFCFALSPAQAQPKSARDIMAKVDQVAKSSSHASYSLIKLSTCRFNRGKRIRCSEKPRVKKMESVTMSTGKDLLDTKSISILLEPASEKGIGMLSFTYDDSKRDSESWLYLSALGKVKRMASGSDEDAEPTSFFGSELTTEEMDTGNVDEYQYQILKEGKLGSRPVWIIESIPNAERLPKTRYSKTISWIDQERFITLKVKTYDKMGKAYKGISFFKVEKIKEFWIARTIIILNHQTLRMSKLSQEKIALEIQVSKEFLTARTLTDFAFRESHLKKIRKQIE